MEREGRRLASTLVVPAQTRDASDGQATFLDGVVESAGGTQGEASSRSRIQSRPRVSASRLLAGQPVTNSLQELQSLLVPGYEVVVTDHAGRSRRGLVASISRERLVIAAPVAAGQWEALLPLYWPVDVGVVIKRRFFRSDDWKSDEADIARIDIVDSTRNGTAIGAAAGAALVAGVYQWERRQSDSNLKGVATFLAVVWGFPVSVRIGHVLDRAINEPIYQQQPGRRRVTVLPWFDGGRTGVSAQVEWP